MAGADDRRDLAAAYLRWSTERQEDSESTQRAVLSEFAIQRGLRIVSWYTDAALSGGSVAPRDGLVRLLADAPRAPWRTLLLYKLDRAFRNLEEQIACLRRLQRAGVRVLGARDPELDGHQGELIGNVLGAVNEFERRITGQRVRDHNRLLAARGRYTGGRAPFGYRYDPQAKALTVEHAEGESVRLLFSLYISTQSAAATARRLNETGAHRASARSWSAARVLEIIRNPVYGGMVAYGRREPVQGGRRRLETYEAWPGSHEGLVTAEAWETAQAIRAANRTEGRKPARCEALSGLLRCGLCGLPARVHHVRPGYWIYRCLAGVEGVPCAGWTRSGPRMEEAALGMLRRNLRAARISPKVPSRNAPQDGPQAALTSLEARRERALEAHEAGYTTLEQLGQRLAAIDAERQRLIARQQTATPSADPSAFLRDLDSLAAWDGLLPVERNRLMRHAVRRAVCDGEHLVMHFIPVEAPGWLLRRSARLMYRRMG